MREGDTRGCIGIHESQFCFVPTIECHHPQTNNKEAQKEAQKDIGVIFIGIEKSHNQRGPIHWEEICERKKCTRNMHRTDIEDKFPANSVCDKGAHAMWSVKAAR